MREPECRDKREQVPTPFLYHPETYPIIAESMEPVSTKGRVMHIGQLIKQELEEQGRTVVWFARKLSYSRANVYKIFEKSSIDTNVLMRISSLLGVDFFQCYSKELDQKEEE